MFHNKQKEWNVFLSKAKLNNLWWLGLNNTYTFYGISSHWWISAKKHSSWGILVNHFFARELYTEDQTLLSLKSMKVLFATSVGVESDQRQYLCIFCPRITMSLFLFLCMSVGVQLCSCNYLWGTSWKSNLLWDLY